MHRALLLLFSSHEQKIASTEANEEKRYGAADGFAHAGASNALWPVTPFYGFKGRGPQEEAVALVRGQRGWKTAPYGTRSLAVLTGDVLTSLRCDFCRAQLELSLKKIGQASSGVLLYSRQEAAASAVMNKCALTELQDGGMDTVEGKRNFGLRGGRPRL